MAEIKPLLRRGLMAFAPFRVISSACWQDPAVRFRAIAPAIAAFALALLAALAPVSPWAAFARIVLGYSLGVTLFILAFTLVSFIGQRLRDLRSQQDGDSRNAYRDYLHDSMHLDTLVALASIIVTVASFTVYKTMVLPAGGYHHDAAFIALDRMLLGGMDGWVLTHRLLPGADATWLIDFIYFPLFLPMIVGYAACAGLRARPQLRYTYMTSFLAGFVLVGMIAADVFGSAGPIFDGIVYGDGSTFEALQRRLRSYSDPTDPLFSVRAQDHLLMVYQEGIVQFGSGISAMPSVHLVMAGLWGVAAWHMNRVLGLLLTAYVMVIWVGSVHLGWHYASDGLVALVMTLAIWRVAGRTFGLIGRKVA
jgi:hypothetical protein